MPQRPPSGVEEGRVEVLMVAVVGVVVLRDDVLQVGVLPVQVAGLDGSCEDRPVRPRQRVCERRQMFLNVKLRGSGVWWFILCA